ncbi:MAG: sigma-70 family RNA polymerase sigma factor [Chloroflexi bacterium]|nr:sigma-70 family RNA polymerase sigma factor [Chloroflexota bacterium]MCI0574743.1 sigma-70 family RNA polymerase sigma factor [Chloroflexota bacterium]MCI0645688.1 sigma-70 family RNA polymerase sigma factor [Chloroflexota bacterium]MCI0726494.1 sigma-70 family RNA polymerase sigma factor [Chloroflexota bacterium]
MKHLKTESTESARAESGSLGFEALFLEHWASVYRILRRLVGDPEEAEDLALEAFLRLYRHNQKRPEIQNSGGWLYQVATRLGLNSIRDWKRREQYELTAGRYALEEPAQLSPAEILAQEEERQQVRLALARMNERQSQLLILRYSGFSYKEIASALNLAPASIGPLLVRAEREFEKQYRALAEEE